MSEDGKLSQEEIDALLGKVDLEVPKERVEEVSSPDIETVLSPMEQDALGEIGNISFGSAATALSTLLNQKVEITTPSVSVVSRHHLNEEFPVPNVSVRVEYTEGFRGSNVLLINMKDASIIADLMMGGDGSNASNEIGELQLSAVQEAMNQMMGSSSTAMSTMFNKRIDISPPSIQVLNVEEQKGLDHLPHDDYFLKIKFSIKIGNLIDSSIMQVVPIDFSKELVSELMNPGQAGTTDRKEEQQVLETPKKESVSVPDAPTLSDRLNAGSMSVSEPPRTEPVYNPVRKEKPEVHVQPVAFSSFEDVSSGSKESTNIDLLLDIPLDVTVELGRTHRLIKDILSLVPGTVVELDKLAGEPVDILINNKPIAKGEVVVIDENFGVRIIEIINKRDRLKSIYDFYKKEAN